MISLRIVFDKKPDKLAHNNYIKTTDYIAFSGI